MADVQAALCGPGRRLQEGEQDAHECAQVYDNGNVVGVHLWLVPDRVAHWQELLSKLDDEYSAYLRRDIGLKHLAKHDKVVISPAFPFNALTGSRMVCSSCGLNGPLRLSAVNNLRRVRLDIASGPKRITLNTKLSPQRVYSCAHGGIDHARPVYVALFPHGGPRRGGVLAVHGTARV